MKKTLAECAYCKSKKLINAWFLETVWKCDNCNRFTRLIKVATK